MLEVSLDQRSTAHKNSEMKTEMKMQAKIEKSTNSFLSAGSKTVSTTSKQMYGAAEAAIGIQGRQVRIATQKSSGKLRDTTPESEAEKSGLQITELKFRATDGKVEKVDVLTEWMDGLANKVSEHMCDGQVFIASAGEQSADKDNLIDVEVPGLSKLLKFSPDGFQVFS